MLVLCSVRRAPKGHLCCWSFCFCCCGKLSYWPCLTVLSYSQSPRAPLLMIYIFGSSSKGHLLIWYIESCQKSVIWDERLFVSVSDSIFLCLCPPALSLCSLTVKEGCERRRIMTPRRCTQRFLALHGENTIQESSFCRWLPHWWFFPHKDLLEWIFSYSYTTQWFLSL